LTESDDVLIIGAGLVGVLTALTCLHNCKSVTITDTLEDKLSYCRDISGVVAVASEQLSLGNSSFVNKFTKIFICINSDASEWMSLLPDLMRQEGNGYHRSAVICVGRFPASMLFSVDLGNIDIKISSRCGEGYRDENYYSGSITVTPVSGEHSVTQNLIRAASLSSLYKRELEGLASTVLTFDNRLPSLYRDFLDNTTELAGIITYPSE
jgi:hypothetical protein